MSDDHPDIDATPAAAAPEAPAAPEAAAAPDAPVPPLDGRHRRREHNRDAVVSALLALFHEGVLAPSSAQIAERAGLSQRSVFRYFDDLEDLARAAIGKQLAELGPLLHIDAADGADLDARARALAEQRVRLFDGARHVGVVSRLRAPFHEVVEEQLVGGRRFLRRQVATLFAAELAQLPADARDDALGVLDVLTSFETEQLLRHDQGRDPADVVEVMARAVVVHLRAALAQASPTAGSPSP